MSDIASISRINPHDPDGCRHAGRDNRTTWYDSEVLQKTYSIFCAINMWVSTCSGGPGGRAKRTGTADGKWRRLSHHGREPRMGRSSSPWDATRRTCLTSRATVTARRRKGMMVVKSKRRHAAHGMISFMTCAVPPTKRPRGYSSRVQFCVQFGQIPVSILLQRSTYLPISNIEIFRHGPPPSPLQSSSSQELVMDDSGVTTGEYGLLGILCDSASFRRTTNACRISRTRATKLQWCSVSSSTFQSQDRSYDATMTRQAQNQASCAMLSEPLRH